MKDEERERRRQLILQTYEQTGSIKATRRRLGFSIKAIRRALRGEDQRPLVTAPAPRPSKLDPYKPLVQRLVLEDRLTAVLVLEELRRLGFEGSYTIIKEHVRTIPPRPKVKVTTVLEHPPGAEGQVDWSPYRVFFGSTQVVVHAFSFVLPFSRYMVLRFALDETLDTLVALHEEAFEEIGAIPARMSYTT